MMHDSIFWSICGLLVSVGFPLQWAATRRMERKKAREYFDTFHGEAIDFTKLSEKRSGHFIQELVRLEKQRIQMKLEKLTEPEREAVNQFLGFLARALPIPLTDAEIEVQWERGSKSREYAKKAQEWLEKTPVIVKVEAPRPTLLDQLNPSGRQGIPFPEQRITSLAAMEKTAQEIRKELKERGELADSPYAPLRKADES